MSNIPANALAADFSAFCSLTDRAKNEIRQLSGATNVLAGLQAGWKTAYKNKQYRNRGKEVYFCVSFASPAGAVTWFEIRMKPSDPKKAKDGKAFYIYAADKMEGKPREYNSFRDFAFVEQSKGPNERNLYRDLANTALAEPWSFTKEDGTDLLERYLDATFLRVLDEDKISYGEDVEGELATFCTGLVNKRFEDIYCVCVKNSRGNLPWRVDAFCTRGSSHAGKRLQKIFGTKLPARANYFSSKTDAIYDSSLPLVPDYEHLMLRLGRIAIPTLRELFAEDDEALDLIRKAEHIGTVTERDMFLTREFGKIKLSDSRYYAISQRLESAVKVAQARVRYMYSNALPAWNPKRYVGGQAYFCLPLCLLDENHTDTVLIAVLQSNSAEPYYEGATLYTLNMAYRDARAVQRTDGLTGWIGGAFASQDSDEDKAPKPSDFASNVAPQLTPPPVPIPVPAPVPAEPVRTKAAMLRAVPDPTDPNFSCALEVHNGDEIGIARRSGEKLPEILLPTHTDKLYQTFFNVSQHHGVFSLNNGIWSYEQRGSWPTDIFHADGTRITLSAKGQSTAFASGDEFSFAGSMRLKFEA